MCVRTSYTAELLATGECRVGVDVGCGSSSPLSVGKPGLRTIGIDASAVAIREAQARELHDDYVLGDLLDEGFFDAIAERFRAEPPDIVALYGMIEHLPKRQGFDLLRRCEALTAKFVILETPNGFVEQGPEFGNDYQRHLSGWFPHDFEGLGYAVRGSTGLRSMLGYAAGLRWDLPGMGIVNALGSRLARVGTHPRRAYNLVALKDVRGVAARLGSARLGSAG